MTTYLKPKLHPLTDKWLCALQLQGIHPDVYNPNEIATLILPCVEVGNTDSIRVQGAIVGELWNLYLHVDEGRICAYERVYAASEGDFNSTSTQPSSEPDIFVIEFTESESMALLGYLELRQTIDPVVSDVDAAMHEHGSLTQLCTPWVARINDFLGQWLTLGYQNPLSVDTFVEVLRASAPYYLSLDSDD
jgi:hypothetical protein